MDLMKLLKHKTKEVTQERVIHSDGSSFIFELSNLIKDDLSRLAATESGDDWVRLAKIMKVYSGNLDENADPNTEGYNYLFLNVPSMRGFMVELNNDSTEIDFRRGTLIVPLKRNLNEELLPSTLFVTSPQIIDTFEVRGPKVIRSHSTDKTYSSETFAEHLLSAAFGLTEPE